METRQAKPRDFDPTEVESLADIQDEHRDFLHKVMAQGKLADPYDARDITEVVYRVMRDLMGKETIEHVESELHTSAANTDEKALNNEVADLWRDTNPIVGFISRIRQPLRGPAPIGIDSKLFLTRVANEGGLPPTTNAETVVTAVFSATKEELSSDRIQEVATCLPDQIRALWEAA